MKKTILGIIALSAIVAFGGDIETKTITTTGTISEFTPGQVFVLRESTGPIKYRYGNTVVYVTKRGKTLTQDEIPGRIRVGIPVSVQYTTEGEDRVISRVEVDEED